MAQYGNVCIEHPPAVVCQYPVMVAWSTTARLSLDTLQSMTDRGADSLRQGYLESLVLVRGPEDITSKTSRSHAYMEFPTVSMGPWISGIHDQACTSILCSSSS